MKSKVCFAQGLFDRIDRIDRVNREDEVDKARER